MKMVEFDKSIRDALAKAYEKAVLAGDIAFEFEENVYLVSYAKFLLEYLDNQFAAKEKKS